MRESIREKKEEIDRRKMVGTPGLILGKFFKNGERGCGNDSGEISARM